MQVVLIRHAIAETREIFALDNADDHQRPLLPAGKKKMRKAVKGLRTLLPSLDLIVSSPLVRAVETAGIVHGAYKNAKLMQLAMLAPGQPALSVAAWLQKQAQDATVALVGHEPDLGQLATWLLAGNSVEPFVEFKKGGMMLLDFVYKVETGHAQLRWLLGPAQLRELGR